MGNEKVSKTLMAGFISRDPEEENRTLKASSILQSSSDVQSQFLGSDRNATAFPYYVAKSHSC